MCKWLQCCSWPGKRNIRPCAGISYISTSLDWHCCRVYPGVSGKMYVWPVHLEHAGKMTLKIRTVTVACSTPMANRHTGTRQSPGDHQGDTRWSPSCHRQMPGSNKAVAWWSPSGHQADTRQSPVVHHQVLWENSLLLTIWCSGVTRKWKNKYK